MTAKRNGNPNAKVEFMAIAEGAKLLKSELQKMGIKDHYYSIQTIPEVFALKETETDETYLKTHAAWMVLTTLNSRLNPEGSRNWINRPNYSDLLSEVRDASIPGLNNSTIDFALKTAYQWAHHEIEMGKGSHSTANALMNVAWNFEAAAKHPEMKLDALSKELKLPEIPAQSM